MTRSASIRVICLMLAHSEKRSSKIMETVEKNTNSKGGRPKKNIKKDQVITVKFTKVERWVIKAIAENAGLTISELLRQKVLGGKIDRFKKAFPSEVLQLTGTLNHLAANLNQIPRKRNSMEQLDSFERAELELQSRELKNISATIKKYFE